MLPVQRFTRKSIRQTFWTGAAFLAAAILWLVGSLLMVASFSPQAGNLSSTQAWLIILPSTMLLLAGLGFLSVWGGFYLNRLMGLWGTDDDPQS